MPPDLTFLRRLDALAEGHFQLASGRHSGHYVLKNRLTERPVEVDRLLRERRVALDALGPVDTVFTPAIGALPLAQQVGLVLGTRVVFAERDADNRLVLKRGFALEPGERLLLVEDVMTTGGTLKELAELARVAGADIRGVFVLVNRSASATWEGYPLQALATVAFPTWSPEDCPLCRAGLPLERPGTKRIVAAEAPSS